MKTKSNNYLPALCDTIVKVIILLILWFYVVVDIESGTLESWENLSLFFGTTFIWWKVIGEKPSMPFDVDSFGIAVLEMLFWGILWWCGHTLLSMAI